MEIRLLSAPDDLRRYDAWVRAHPHGSLWQSLAWQTFREAAGQSVCIYAVHDGTAIQAAGLVVIDKTSMGYATWELPRGPLWRDGKEAAAGLLLQHIVNDARRARCISLRFSPPAALPAPQEPPGCRPSGRHVHPEATRLLDLAVPEEEILAQMKPKGRYNIRLAEKHGVTVEAGKDATVFAALMRETGSRDGFVPHGEAHYRHFLTHLPGSFLLLAYTSDLPESPQDRSHASEQAQPAPSLRTPVAGLLGVVWEGIGIYYYGASSYAARSLMAPYLLQWEAMRRCKTAGCTRYDLFGIAPDGATGHPWSGVTDFKGKFGGTYVEYPAEREIILQQLVHGALQLKRRVIG